MPKRQPPADTLHVSLSPSVLTRLRSRGAHSDRARGPLNYTRQLTRTLNLYESAILRSDPRETQDLPEAHYDLVLDLLDEPEALTADAIQGLGGHLLNLSTFPARARALGADPQRLAQTINALTYAEKLHLVNAAQVHHAPPAKDHDS